MCMPVYLFLPPSQSLPPLRLLAPTQDVPVSLTCCSQEFAIWNSIVYTTIRILLLLNVLVRFPFLQVPCLPISLTSFSFIHPSFPSFYFHSFLCPSFPILIAIPYPF